MSSAWRALASSPYLANLRELDLFGIRNAAFSEAREAEIARILREIAEKVERGSTQGKVYDVNGNNVGSFLVEDE